VAEVIDYNVEGVESGGGGGSVEPKPGVYPARIVVAAKRTEKNDRTPANDVKVTFDLGGDYTWVNSYIGLGPESDWKLAEFIRALGLREKGKLDLKKIQNKMVRVKINADTYENEYRGKVGRIMPGAPDDVLPEPSANGAGPEASADDDVDVEPDAESGVLGSGYPPTDEFPNGYEPERETDDNKYDDWSDDDIEGEFTDRALAAPGGRGNKRTKMITALRADDENPVQPEGDAGDGAGSGEDDDYDSWDSEQLEKELTDRQLDVPKKPRGSNAEQRHMDAMIEALREDDNADPFENK
jgi:hypothetical protein